MAKYFNTYGSSLTYFLGLFNPPYRFSSEKIQDMHKKRTKQIASESVLKEVRSYLRLDAKYEQYNKSDKEAALEVLKLRRESAQKEALEELKLQSLIFLCELLENPTEFQNIFFHNETSRNIQKNEFLRNWLHAHNPLASLLVSCTKNDSLNLEKELANSTAFSNQKIADYFDKEDATEKDEILVIIQKEIGSMTLDKMNKEMSDVKYVEDDDLSVMTVEEFVSKPVKAKPFFSSGVLFKANQTKIYPAKIYPDLPTEYQDQEKSTLGSSA